MPVLPLVASMTVCPGLSEPSRSAASITPSASRSLTEPSGLNASSFTNSSTPAGAMLLMRTTGVLPTVSSIDFLIPAIPCLRYFRRRKRQGNVPPPAKSIVGPPAFIRALSSRLRRHKGAVQPARAQLSGIRTRAPRQRRVKQRIGAAASIVNAARSCPVLSCGVDSAPVTENRMPRWPSPGGQMPVKRVGKRTSTRARSPAADTDRRLQRRAARNAGPASAAPGEPHAVAASAAPGAVARFVDLGVVWDRIGRPATRRNFASRTHAQTICWCANLFSIICSSRRRPTAADARARDPARSATLIVELSAAELRRGGLSRQDRPGGA